MSVNLLEHWFSDFRLSKFYSWLKYYISLVWVSLRLTDISCLTPSILLHNRRAHNDHFTQTTRYPQAFSSQSKVLHLTLFTWLPQNLKGCPLFTVHFLFSDRQLNKKSYSTNKMNQNNAQNFSWPQEGQMTIQLLFHIHTSTSTAILLQIFEVCAKNYLFSKLDGNSTLFSLVLYKIKIFSNWKFWKVTKFTRPFHRVFKDRIVTSGWHNVYVYMWATTPNILSQLGSLKTS